MKSFPYVGKHQDTIKLFFSPSRFAAIESGHGFSRHESNYTNITHEYLSNTWGEVESKEHAEFIIELAELHGFEFVAKLSRKHKYFRINESYIGFYETEIGALHIGFEQITIPLPPKAELNHSGKKLTPDEIKAFYNSDIHGNELPEAGHNLVFAAPECKEWPCVGDEVRSIYSSNVCVVMAKNEKQVCAEWKGKLMILDIKDLQKPKTPEEALRDDIIAIANLKHPAGIAHDLMAKYNITPKEV